MDGTPVNVLITQSGTATFQVQVTYTNGQQFSQTCSLQISNNNTSNRMMGEGDPDGSYWWSSTIPFQGYDESAAYCGKNLINVYYKTGSNTLTKPIIIVDGFDPNDQRDAKKIYKDLFQYKDATNTPSNFYCPPGGVSRIKVLWVVL